MGLYQEAFLESFLASLESFLSLHQEAFLESYGRHMVSKYREEGLQRFGEALYRFVSGVWLFWEQKSETALKLHLTGQILQLTTILFTGLGAEFDCFGNKLL